MYPGGALSSPRRPEFLPGGLPLLRIISSYARYYKSLEGNRDSPGVRMMETFARLSEKPFLLGMGVQLAPPVDCTRWRPCVVEHMWRGRASTPYGFSRPPADNTSALGMGGSTAIFLIEMAILHLSGFQYADFIADVAILMRTEPASFSSGAEEGRRYCSCGGRYRAPSIYRIAPYAVRVD